MMIRYWLLNSEGYRTEHKFTGTREQCMQVALIARLSGCGGWELYEKDMSHNDFFDYERKQQNTVATWYDKGAISSHPLKKDPKK